MPESRRRQFITTLAAGSAGLVAGCGGNGSDGTETGTGTSSDGQGGATGSGESYQFYRGTVGRDAHFPERSAHDQAISNSWQYGTDGSLVHQPVVANGSIYVADRDGVAYGINAVTQSEQWQTDVTEGIGGSPAITDGTMYVPGDNGTLFALDASSGDEQWRYETGKVVVRSPVVTDRTVYVVAEGASGVIAALDAGSGTEQWSEQLSTGSSTAPAASNGLVYTQTGDGITAFTPDGQREWTNQAVRARRETISTDGDSVYFVRPGAPSTQYNERRNAELISVNAADGTEQWRFKPGELAIPYPAALDGSAAYILSGGRLYKIDKETGEEQWATSPPGGAVNTAPVIYGDTLYVTGGGATFAALAKSDGSERWTADFDVGTFEPVLVGGTVYLSVRSSVRAFE